MQQRLGTDLSHVRVHTDAQAAASARAVRALAYTVGRSIVFDTGRYAPDHADGRQLLAHELVHVVQQRGVGAVGSGPIAIDPSPRAEQEAERLAHIPSDAGETPSRPVEGASALQRVPAPVDVTVMFNQTLASGAWSDAVRALTEMPAADRRAALSAVNTAGRSQLRRASQALDPRSSTNPVLMDLDAVDSTPSLSSQPAVHAAASSLPTTIPRPIGLPRGQGFALAPIVLPADVLGRLQEGELVTLPIPSHQATQSAPIHPSRPGDANVPLRLVEALGPGGAIGLHGMNAALRTSGLAAAGDYAIGLVAIPRTQMNIAAPHFNMFDPAAPLDTWGHTAMYVRQNGSITHVRGFNPELLDAALNYGAVEAGTHASPAVLSSDAYLFTSTAARTVEWPVDPAVAARVVRGAPPTGPASAVGAPPYYTARPAALAAADPVMGAQCSNCGLWATEQVEGALGGQVGRAGQPPITSVAGRASPPVPRTASQGQLVGLVDDAAVATRSGVQSPLSPMPGAIGEPVAATMSGGMRVMKYLGRGFLVLGVAATGYEIYAAAPDQRERTAVGAISGFAGGLAVGAAAGLVCGPGAPVCSVVLGLTFGFAGALGSRAIAEGLYDAAHPGGTPTTVRDLEAANAHGICPNCHAVNAVRPMRPPGLASPMRSGAPPQARHPTLSASELDLIQRWVASDPRASRGHTP